MQTVSPVTRYVLRMKDKAVWIKAFIVLVVVGFLAVLLPSRPIDPWNLLNLKKMTTMMFVLAFIQISGSVIYKFVGIRVGSLLTGFFGGLVSSTATTLSIARKSKIEDATHTYAHLISFLATTCAMLVQGAVLVYLGEGELHVLTLIPFAATLTTALGLILFYYRRVKNSGDEIQHMPFKIIPFLKLSAFIVLILVGSKILQKIAGKNGLMAFTAVVSLFEIHGSIIANVQLHESGVISMSLLRILFALSIGASCLSKLFMIFTVGSRALRIPTIKVTLILLTVLGLSLIRF